MVMNRAEFIDNHNDLSELLLTEINKVVSTIHHDETTNALLSEFGSIP
jgi:hypothetical protein